MKYDKSLETLIKESMKQEPPTRAEERALYWKMQNGVDGARDELVTRNMRFVMHLAKTYTSHGVSLTDLVQEGALAMCEATETWSPNRGMRFSGYAGWYIKNALKAAICRTGSAVTLPRINYNHSKAKACLREMLSELGRMPTGKEFQEKTGFPGHAAPVMAVLLMPQYSLEDSVSRDDDDGTWRRDLIADENADASTMAEDNDMRRWLESMMCDLSDREIDIIKKRFGWDDDVEVILEDIGKERGVTREAIRQTQKHAMRKMKAVIVRGDVKAGLRRMGAVA